MGDVFISYAREDKALVSRLHDALERRGRSVWVDWEGIPPTAEWLGEIYGAIDSSEAFLFIISPDSVASPVCGKELRHAVDQNKRLVPLVFREPDAESVQASLRELNWIYIREADDFEGAVDALVEALDTDLERVKAHTRLLVRALEWDSRKRHSLLLGGRDLEEAEQQFVAGSQLEPSPTPLQLRYVGASRKHATTVQRRILTSVTLAMLVAIVLATVAWFQQQISERRQTAAVVRNLAEAKPLDALARAVGEMDRWFADRVPEVRSSLLAALQTPKQRTIHLREGSRWPVASVAVMPGGVVAAALDPRYPPGNDKKSVAIWGDDGTWRDWTISAPIVALAGCPTASVLLAIGRDGSAHLRNLDGGAQPLVIALGDAGATEEDADCATSNAGAINSYSRPAPEPECKLSSSAPVVAAFTSDCWRFVIGRNSATQIWTREGVPRKIATIAETHSPLAIAVSGDGHRVARGYEDGSIHMAVSDDGKTFEDAPYASHRSFGGVGALAMNPNGTYLASADGNTLRLWHDVKGVAQPVGDGFHGHDDEITALAFDPVHGAFVASGGNDNTVRVWDLEGNSLGGQRRGHESWVRSVAVSGDGQSIFSGSNDGSVRRWDVTAGPVPLCDEPIKVRGDADALRTRLARARGEDTGRRDPYTVGPKGENRATMERVGTDPVAISASGRYVARYDTTNKRIVVRDSEGEQKDWTIAHPRSNLDSVAIAPDGDTVAHAGNDGSIRLSNRTAGELRPLVGGHLLPVTSLAFGPKGHVLASGSEDNTIRLWNVKAGKSLGPPPLRGHEGWVSALAISPDGRFVASGSWDRTVRLWDIDGHAMGIPFRGHRAWVSDVGFDAERTQIVSRDDSGRVEVWQGGDETDWLRAACRQLSGQVSRTDDTYTRADYARAHELCAKAFPDTSTLRKTPGRCVGRVDAARAPSANR